MFANILLMGRASLDRLRGMKVRHDTAFAVLHPQVETVKASPTARLAAGVGIAGLVVTGNFAAAVTVTAAWVGSRPLTHVAAGGLACIGEIDAAVQRAIARLDRAAA